MRKKLPGFNKVISGDCSYAAHGPLWIFLILRTSTSNMHKPGSNVRKTKVNKMEYSLTYWLFLFISEQQWQRQCCGSSRMQHDLLETPAACTRDRFDSLTWNLCLHMFTVIYTRRTGFFLVCLCVFFFFGRKPRELPADWVLMKVCRW